MLIGTDDLSDAWLLDMLMGTDDLSHGYWVCSWALMIFLVGLGMLLGTDDLAHGY